MGEWILLGLAAWWVTRRFDVGEWVERSRAAARRNPWFRAGRKARLENLLRRAWRDMLELAGDAAELAEGASRKLTERRAARPAASIPGPAAEALASLERSMTAATRDRPEPGTSPRPHRAAPGSASTPPLRSVSP